MITETINEVKKIEAEGTAQVKLAEETSQEKIKKTYQSTGELVKQNRNKITSGYDVKLKEEKEKSNKDLIEAKQKADKERLELGKTIQPKITKAVDFIENKIRSSYGNS